MLLPKRYSAPHFLITDCNVLLLSFLRLRLYYEKSDRTWKLELTTRSKEPTHCLLKTAVLVFSSPSHSVFSLFQRPACDENLSFFIYIFFIRLLLVTPPAMVSGPAGNSTQFWSGGGRLLNDGDESDVKACNSRTHTHTHTTLRWKSYTCSRLWYQGCTASHNPIRQEKTLGKEFALPHKNENESL